MKTGLKPSFEYSVVAYPAAILLETAVRSHERFGNRRAENKANSGLDCAVDADEENDEE